MVRHGKAIVRRRSRISTRCGFFVSFIPSKIPAYFVKKPMDILLTLLTAILLLLTVGGKKQENA